MATQITINLTDAEEVALKGALQWTSGKESFNDIAVEYLRVNTLDPVMKNYVANEELKKIESIIESKKWEVEFKPAK